ncbi:MAG: type I restriction-modification system subunit M [Bacilli bacterium]
MNNNKEREREELHKTIWRIANDLRGSVDGWDFKQYVLGLLFYRFISENIENYINTNQRKAGETDFEYRNLSDEEAEYGKEDIVKDKGFFILPSELFFNVRKGAKNNPDLNVTINNIFDNIESSAKGTTSEYDVKGLFDDFDVKGNKLGNTVDEKNDKLVKMLDAIGDLKLGDYKDNTIDTFGDAYEYLMTMYASNAGKSGGEFFTPQEVGELLAKITLMGKTELNKVYDPCCGSGSLLLKFAKILGKENVKQGYFGQEINLTTYNLARINMFLHDINYNKFNIARGDTLVNPMHWDDEPFDAIVSNPPYSIRWAGKSNPILINDERFSPAGILAPESKADLAFTMHMLSWLSPKGTAAIVQFPGVLYRSGAEQKIRKYMVDNNFIDSVIQLPSDLFFGTGISTCILVLKKSKGDNNILFIDASNEFVRNTNKNKLSDENIDNILKLLEYRKNVDYKSVLISNEEISNNDYNISVNSYLKSESKEEKIDIKKLNKRIEDVVKRESKIRIELDAIIKELEGDSYE